MKRGYGRLRLLKAVEEPNTIPEGSEAISKYMVYDDNTFRIVFIAPGTDEGLKNAENVMKVKQEQREQKADTASVASHAKW